MSSKQSTVSSDKKLEITIDQLKNYLGTGLEIASPKFKDGRSIKIELKGRHIPDNNWENSELSSYRPICYRLSDLDKLIPELGFVPILKLAELITQAGWNHHRIQSCLLENDTFTISYKVTKFPGVDLWTQSFFEIDIDDDFGFSIYSKKWMGSLENNPEEIESMTGNIWVMYQKIFEWNFWPFGDEYFNQGLVIDKKLCGAATLREQGKESPNV